MPCDLAVLIPDVYNTGQASHLLSLDVNSKLGPVMLASLLINVLAISRRALEKTWGINFFFWEDLEKWEISFRGERRCKDFQMSNGLA